jgi:hypothetical protein
MPSVPTIPPDMLPPPGDPFDIGPPPPPDPLLVPPETQGPMLNREKPEPDEKRKALVTSLTDMVKQAKSHWEKVFKRMERDQRFAAGVQWDEDPKISIYNDVQDDDLYVANITLQHIQKRVSATYAKNPQARARRRPRVLSTVWDGSMESLAQAQAVVAQAQQASMLMTMGMAGGAGLPSVAPGMAPTTTGPGAGAGAGGLDGMPPPGAINTGSIAGAPGGAPAGAPGDAGGSPGAPGSEGAPGAAQPTPPMPQMPPLDEVMNAQAVIQDAQQVKQQLTILNKIGRTMEILYEYEISEQQQSFKSMMKMTVRRAATSGVGWARLGFQRLMGRAPDLDSRLADAQAQLDLIQRISADIADDEVDMDSAAAEEMRLAIQAMAKETDVVLREGLLFTWPKSTAIIPDPRCVQLREFLGCDWVAEEFCLSVNEIQETYGVDVSKSHNNYARIDTGTDYERARAVWQAGGSYTDNARIDSGDGDNCLVWEMFNKRDGLVYVICDGYPDFLREPGKPDVYTDRFWPWFLVAFNELPGTVFPISDVSLIRPMQRELNRARQGLREHRVANRPKTAYSDGVLSEDDIEAFKNHPVNAMIAVTGLQPGQDINQLLQAVKGAPIDPNLYEVNPVFQDLMRAVGDQEADLGGTSGDTATESSIAASAKATSVGSAVDDIDETLSGIARASGQILLLNVSEDTVKSIVGPGAMWPVLTKGEVARDLYLDIQAGSSGRPNQAQELQNFQQLAPILMQLPGIKPSFLAKQAIQRMDDKIDVDEAIADGLPSVQAMNGGKVAGLPGQQIVPSQQGAQGSSNAPAPPAPNSQSPGPPLAQPAPPSPSPTTRLQ